MDEKRTKITEEHFRSFYKCTPEDKSASPSGLHLGHYKSAASNETFSFVLWSIICMAYQNSFCLDRWKLSATTLLEKIPGFPKIHKFRTIHIIESDLNFVMRFIWGREFMAHNESNDGFHDNQYGGRKGRQPQSAILNKVLTLDIVRYQAEEAGLLDNDAKACYDRVLPYLTAYMLRRLGMPYFLSRFMCVVLKEMEYKIKLSNGMTASYSNKNKTVFGTGQGAGWSPTCWAANSDVISHSMEKYTPGMALRHPDGKVYSNITLVAFVDDTSMGVTQEGINTFNPKPYWPVQPQQTMYKQLEANIGFYGRTLESTGGALAWEKCKAYLIMFLWLNGVKIMINNKNDFPALRVFSLLTGMYHFIKLANPDEAFRMLGAFVAPNGSMSTQIKILKELALKWARKITKSYLTPHECLIAYKQVLFPALVYPLAVMPVSEKDCDDIIRPALNALLTKLNINKTTCRKLLYGPARYGGMELPNIYVYGNILKVMMLIGHMQKEDATMPILTTSIATVQQQTGVSIPVLQSNFSKYELLVEQCWIKHVWQFLHEINGNISIANAWIPQSNHNNDIMLMDKVMEISLPSKTLQQFNLCRLHKRTYFLTDILDSKQKGLHPMIIHPDYQKDTFEKFPNIKLPKRYWKEWEHIIKTIHASSRVSGFHAGLATHSNCIMWLQSKDRNKLLHQIKPNTYRVYKLLEASRNKYVYTKALYHETDIYDTIGYFKVSVNNKARTIETDGYD